MDDVFVLLDDCYATSLRPSSRLYTGFAHQHVCVDPQHLDAVWHLAEADIARGLHAAVFIDYEWGARLLHAGHRRLGPQEGVFRILLFNTLTHLDEVQVSAWLAERDGGAGPTPAGVMALQPSVSRSAFEEGIASILDLIRAGETYQVNYTYRLKGQQFGSPLGLYRRLRSVQPVAFGCLAALPPESANADDTDATRWVLSCSPELFVRNAGGHLTTRPMKGTASRGSGAPAEDAGPQWLSRDPKNRAENVMIVDLLRNDLGRISEIGSVKVPKLFAVETHSTLHQMTSTVESQILPDLGFADVLRALFPCGSITGTPKLHTMDLIADLETTPRGLYCGAIGWVDAPTSPRIAADFCLSVAIRTLQLGPAVHAMRSLTLGVGGGVVIDSTEASEFDETQVKARFLTGLDPGFSLFETLLLRHGNLRHLNLHMKRLQHSAAILGFRFDEAAIRQALQVHVRSLPAPQNHRVRLDLCHDGSVAIQAVLLEPLASVPVSLVWAATEVPVHERALLAHKTSLRQTYDAAIRQAMQQGAFDAVFVNPHGMVTEGARCTLFVKIDGQWCTPSLESGVLPGILRSRVLRMSPGIISRPIHKDELAHAQDFAVCNALRGVVRARFTGT